MLLLKEREGGLGDRVQLTLDAGMKAIAIAIKSDSRAISFQEILFSKCALSFWMHAVEKEL